MPPKLFLDVADGENGGGSFELGSLAQVARTSAAAEFVADALADADHARGKKTSMTITSAE